MREFCGLTGTEHGMRGYRSAKVLFSLLLSIVFLSVLAYGQGAASIVGTVTDNSGAAVPNVKVNITNLGTGFVRSTTTNTTGSYAARELSVGQYKIRVEAQGFKTYEQTGITLNVNDTVRADASLQVGTVQENVTVEATALQVQSDTNEVSQTVTSTQISQLATNGRNVIQLTTLVPGAASQLPDFDSPMAQTQNRSVSFNGQRQDHNNWLIDGGEAYDRGGGGILQVSPSQDAIQEFKVLTSNYAADLGQSSGGLITMAMKSGTRQYHASAWEYNRNDAFDATNWFTEYYHTPGTPLTKPELRYNNWGFNLGGPLQFKASTNPKTFFFYNMEWRRLIRGNQINPNAVPTALWGGDFQSYCATAGCTIKVPQTTDPAAITKFSNAGYAPGQAFTNNKIPAGLIDPNVTLLLNAGIFEKPNTPDGLHFSAAAPERDKYREEAFRIDHQFNDKVSILGHLIYDSAVQSVPTPLWTGDTYPTVGSTTTIPSFQGVVHLTQSISPSLLNEVAYNFNGVNINIGLIGTVKKPSGYNVSQFFTANTANKIPAIGIGAPFNISYDSWGWPWVNDWRSHQWKDDLSWTRGTHNLKFGGAFMYTHKNQQLFGYPEGQYGFNGNASGNNFADFLLGYASSYHELQLQDTMRITANTISIYAMDDWRATKRLTLNLGMRWEGLPTAYDTAKRASNFYPGLYDPTKAPTFLPSGALDPNGPGFGTVSGIPLSNVRFYLNGLGLAGRNGIPAGLVGNHWKTFAPRVGFAYDLTGDQKTVLRGGFGVFYERLAGNQQYNIGSNVPFSNDPGVNNVYFSTPSVSSSNGQAAAAPVFPSSFTTMATNFDVPTDLQYSLGIQRQLRQNAVLTVSYVGSGAYHQSQQRMINTLALNDPNRLGVCAKNCNPGFVGTPTDPNPHRLFPGFNTINQLETGGTSNYNSLQASFRATAWKNLTLTASYTYSHVFDYVDGDLFSNLSNPFDAHYDHGPAGFDRRQILVFSYVYSIPLFRNASSRAAKALLGGWELSGVTTLQSGNPLTVGLGSDNLGLGGGTNNRPNQVSASSYLKNKTNLQWFNASSFAAPAALQFGSSRRGALVGPGRQNWNIALFKAFQFTERAGFELRLETFNSFNHPEFNGVNTNFGDSGNFGKLTGVSDPRVIQLGGKLSF
jgi:hypothetical protein